MISTAAYKDTPSIIDNEIVRNGRRLKYSELTAREKRDYLFDQGIRPTAYGDDKNGPRPDVIGGVVQFSKSALDSIANHLLSETLTRTGDELETPKRKLFHTYGATAKIVFTPEPETPYTGILAETAHGLARFSYAGPVAGVGIVPGLGIKFPVDGDHASENLVVMRKLDRQQSLGGFFGTRSQNSVFQNPFTNILPAPSSLNIIMRAVKRRFEKVVETGKGLHQPLENLAAVHTNGNSVAADKIVAPYRVIFRPTPQAQDASDPSIDFRDDLARNIKIAATIYEIFALTEPQETDLKETGVEALLPHAKKIGALATESEFIASRYGDYRLFFKHNPRFIRDAYRK
ncbi:MAG TPA: hypothetical protein VGL11_03425 [Candidatus Binatia bacterium]|jgi:hypothetical protein